MIKNSFNPSEKLLYQLALLVLLVTTVLLTLFGWQRIDSETDNLTNNLHLLLENNSHWLATALALPLYNFDDATVAVICKSMLNYPEITKIVLNANEETAVFNAVDKTKLKRSPSTPISMVRDITHRGLSLGTIKVYIDTTILQQQIRKMMLATLIKIVILDFSLVVALLFFLSRVFIKPMAQLQQASEQVTAGNLQQKIEINSRNELGRLGDNLETMRITLQDKLTALETEVTMRKDVERELLQAKGYIDNIINSMPSLLISVDSDFTVTQWNDQAEQRFGVAAHAAIGQHVATVCPYLAVEQERITKAISLHQVLSDGIRPVPDSATDRYEDITIYPLVSHGVVGAVIRIDDVTEKVRLHSELAHSRKLDALGHLAGGVAHDFNNMLGGILGGAALLKRSMGAPDKQKKYIDMIIQSGERASELTNKLLAFARKGKAQLKPVDVVSVVNEAVAMLRHSVDKRVDINVTRKTDSSIVVGDFGQLQSALINLGVNAEHAMHNGGQLSYVLDRVSFDRSECDASPFELQPGQYLDVAIRDTGMGISPEVLDRVFDPFFTTKEQGKGTGLGLSAVYGTVQDHGGAITVHSTVGAGTTFHIYLPLADQQERVTAEDEAEIICGSGKILLVDDEAVIRITVKEILESLGYQVVLADNGRKGLEILAEDVTAIDLVILDMVMPEMGGEETFYAMRKLAPELNILLSSGYSRGANLEQLERDGVLGCIRKPYTVVALSQAVDAGLRLSKDKGSPG